MFLTFSPAGRGLLIPSAVALACVLAACGGGRSEPAAANAPVGMTAKATAAGAVVAGAGLIPAGRYAIVNALSGKCVDVAGAGKVDGGNIQQANCNSNLAQVFELSLPASGVYKLSNVGSGKVMDVASASTSDGANVQQWTDNGTNAQRFTVTRAQGNRFVLNNVGSGKCVDVANASTNDGANIQQANCNGTGAQQFLFYPVTDSGRGLLPVGQYSLSSNDSKLCVDIDGASTANGALAVQAACVGSSDSQRFDVLPDATGAYRLRNAASGLMLDIKDVSTADGALLQQWADGGSDNQRFDVKATKSGYQITARHSQRCLDVKDWSKVAGGQIQQWACGGDQANQRWALTPSGDSGSTPTPPDNNGWHLVWQDEFNGNSLDTSKWSFEVNGGGGGNNELQYYTDRPQNAYVANGVLTLQALAERFCGPDGCRDYTSARLRTAGKGDWLYGRMEIRAKLPRGQGMWPAIWMLPSDWSYGGWAASGEIDIMESVNTGASGGDTIYGTLHYGGAWPNNDHKGGSTVPSSSVSDDFHLYAVEWEAQQIRFYVDGVLYHTASDWWSAGGAFPAPFNKRFHMLLNLAVGGNWPGSPNGATTFPQKMEIDYVRVYQKVSGA